MARLVELAETLQCAVVDNAGRMNFPVAPSAQPELPPRRGASAQADVDPRDRDERSLGRAQPVQRPHRAHATRPVTKKGAKIITLGTRDLYLKSNYQDFGRFPDVDLAIAGDGEASLPALIEAGQAPRSMAAASPPSRRAARSSRRHGSP